MEGDQPQNASKTKSKSVMSSSSSGHEHENQLPITSITRLMRQIVPGNAKIHEDAKEMVRRCAAEFIGLITEESNKHCKMNHRRTVTTDDLLRVMSTLGFNNYVEFTNGYLRHIHGAADAGSMGGGTGQGGSGSGGPVSG